MPEPQQIFFGIPTSHMQWTRAPRAGMPRTNTHYYENMRMENSKLKSRRSPQYQSQFQMDFYGTAQDVDGIDVYSKYASGFYGSGYIIFSDPYARVQNACPPEWASPSLIEQGWSNIYDVTPTFANTATNTFNQPLRTTTFNVTTAAAAVPTKIMRIAIPPTHTLKIGYSGSITGTAVLRVRPVNPDGTYATVVDLTALSATASTRMNGSFAGSSYTAVEVYITRTSSATSTIAITSILAQVWPTTTTPLLTGNHVMGVGHHGLTFAGDARVESYEFIQPPTKGMSIVLEETE